VLPFLRCDHEEVGKPEERVRATEVVVCTSIILSDCKHRGIGAVLGHADESAIAMKQVGHSED
jgi:hypothetical protein